MREKEERGLPVPRRDEIPGHPAVSGWRINQTIKGAKCEYRTQEMLSKANSRRWSRPGPVSPDRPSGERIGFPNALPARHSAHGALAEACREDAGLMNSRSVRKFCSDTCRVRAFRLRTSP